MGSPLGPIVADKFMLNVERYLVRTSKHVLNYCRR